MLGLQLLTMAAQADQCAWVSHETAQAASAYFDPGVVWADYCQTCGDKRPTMHTVKDDAAIVEQNNNKFQLRIDGQLVDLAYVYVQVRPAAPRMMNLAKLVQCPATGVDKFITTPGTAPRQ